MDDPSPARPKRWQNYFRRIRSALRIALPFLVGVLATFAGLLLYNSVTPQPHQLTNQDVKNTVDQVLASATPPPAYSVGVYQAIQPSLVLIETKGKDSNGKESDSLGSGVVIDAQGEILTCLHVVAGATEIQLIFFDGSQSTGKVVTTQPDNDIAVLAPDQPPQNIYPALLGNPNAMRVGDEAYVVGNPFGLYSSMSAGVISGFNRSFQPQTSSKKIEGLIQLDAAANPGNSGGPLLNRYGQVIGIVVGIANPTDQAFFVGISFAVPINVAGGAAGLPPY